MLRRLKTFLVIVVLFSLSLTCLSAGRLLTSSIVKPNVLSTILQKERKVEVVARVGKYKIQKLTGWSSPFSEITLSSRYTFRKTSADETGFFIFYEIPIDETRELCLIAQDVNMFPSFPLCLAPLAENFDIIIENVLLSPTISLERNQIPSGKTTKASGMTFPDSKVDVYFFTDNSFTFWWKISNFFQRINLIKTAEAMGLPRYRINSNSNGYFEFSLPPNSPSESRLYVASNLKAIGDSPKSNTLSFQAFNIWAYLKALFGSLKINCSILFILIVIETLILIVLLGFLLRKKKEKKDGKI